MCPSISYYNISSEFFWSCAPVFGLQALKYFCIEMIFPFNSLCNDIDGVGWKGRVIWAKLAGVHWYWRIGKFKF